MPWNDAPRREEEASDVDSVPCDHDGRVGRGRGMSQPVSVLRPTDQLRPRRRLRRAETPAARYARHVRHLARMREWYARHATAGAAVTDPE